MSPAQEVKQVAQNSSESDIQRQHIRQELERRFRHSLQAGQICPLFHLMMRYRMEGHA